MKFNVSQIKKIATDITQLLDAKESVKTKGDGFIEASIWNKFVNGGNTKGNEKVGNGKKSEINNKISFSNAIDSISNYLKNKDIKTISASLKALGINYDFKNITSSNSNTQSSTNVSGYKLGQCVNDVRYIEPDSVMGSSSNTSAINRLIINFNGRPTKTNFNTSHTNVQNTADGYIGDSAQNRRGDCYFLASINAIRNTKNGQALLHQNCKKNGDGSFTVTLPGAIKIRNQYKANKKRCYVTGTYHISSAALDKASKSDKYSKGDIEVIAYELAMEAYRAEMYKTSGKNNNWKTAEGQFNFRDFGQDGDVLSAGFTFDALYILIGNKADVFSCNNSHYEKVRPYKQGEFGYITREEMARRTDADISMYCANTKALGISEINHFSQIPNDIEKMLNKYQGQENNYALTVGFRVAENGPDGKTKAGGGHALNILKITNDTVYVCNPWTPNKIEPIPRDKFIKMATSITATKCNKSLIFSLS